MFTQEQSDFLIDFLKEHQNNMTLNQRRIAKSILAIIGHSSGFTETSPLMSITFSTPLDRLIAEDRYRESINTEPEDFIQETISPREAISRMHFMQLGAHASQHKKS